MKMIRFLIILVFCSCLGTSTFAWKTCSEDEGGGICPDETTCCPTSIPGESTCIPLVHTSTPETKPKGICCADGNACRFGYKCAVDTPSFLRNTKETAGKYCKVTKEAQKFDPNARDTPRYDTCRIPEDATTLYGFPVAVESNDDIHHLAYLSNFGDIVDRDEASKINNESIKTAIIVIHGSLRDVEDYFCAGLSLIQDDENYKNSTLILAPKFATTKDHMDNEFLVWDDHVYADKDYLFHTWRYGADAANAPISSYTALDGLVEHLSDTDRFPNLQDITLVGHSAGGQTLQRWSLLSNSPAWNSVDIRVVVANPRSYAYLDGRRWFDSEFRMPTNNDNKHCPWYNQWLWGLEDGGGLSVPYRDEAVAAAGNASAIATRYASRNVIYLSGEYDTIPQTNDRCGNALQGENRHERALRFYSGLQEYLESPVHAFHTIPRSNHDHALMFQSPQGRDAILGKSSSATTSSDAATSNSSTKEPQRVTEA